MKSEQITRTEFIRNLYIKNRKITYAQVLDAWTKEGRTEPISNPLFYLSIHAYRKGLKRKRQERTNAARRKKAELLSQKGELAAKKTPSSLVYQLESDLDDLISRAESIPVMDTNTRDGIINAIKQARRLMGRAILEQE